jgi:hypothetical protein
MTRYSFITHSVQLLEQFINSLRFMEVRSSMHFSVNLRILIVCAVLFYLNLKHNRPLGYGARAEKAYPQTLFKFMSIIWDIMPYSEMKINQRFRWHIIPIFFRLKPASYLFLASFTIRPWRWRRYVHQKRRLTFTCLHGVIPQKENFSWHPL